MFLSIESQKLAGLRNTLSDWLGRVWKRSSTVASVASLFLAMGFPFTTNAQIVCILCFDQNEPVGPNGENFIMNGSFENHSCYPFSNGYFLCPNSDGYACDLENWTCTGGSSGTYAQMNTSVITVVPDGEYALYFGNYYCHLCSGSENDTSCMAKNSCEIDGIPEGFPLSESSMGGEDGVSFSQTVNDLSIGETYILEFWCGGEDAGFFDEDGIFAVDIGFGDSYLTCPPTDPGETGRVYLIFFMASESSHTIKFTNWGHVSLVSTELIVDNVRLYNAVGPIQDLCETGMNDFPVELSTSLFPNPASTAVTVKSDGPQELIFTLRDSSDRLIIKRIVKDGDSIDLMKIPEGLYFYHFTTREGWRRPGKLVID